jgi:hypothetical protein
MNYKLQPSPMSISSTGESRVPPPSTERWHTPAKASDAKFFRLRLVYHSDLETIRSHNHVNWSMMLGLALATAVSACFWAGVALMIAHIWK